MPFGTAPTTFSAFLAPAAPTNGWLWAVGPVVQIPTISSATLGSNVWGGGATAAIVYMKGPIVAGALANNVWSFGGTTGRGGTSNNQFLIQPFGNYNFGGFVGNTVPRGSGARRSRLFFKIVDCSPCFEADPGWASWNA